MICFVCKDLLGLVFIFKQWFSQIDAIEEALRNEAIRFVKAPLLLRVSMGGAEYLPSGIRYVVSFPYLYKYNQAGEFVCLFDRTILCNHRLI